MRVEMLSEPHVKCLFGVSGYSQHLNGHIVPNAVFHEDAPYIGRNEVFEKNCWL
jgi:hypothetical protein